MHIKGDNALEESLCIKKREMLERLLYFLASEGHHIGVLSMHGVFLQCMGLSNTLNDLIYKVERARQGKTS